MVYGEYVIEAQAKLAAKLADLLPAGLHRVYVTQQWCRRLSRGAQNRTQAYRTEAFVAFDGAYHGDTMGALALAGSGRFGRPSRT